MTIDGGDVMMMVPMVDGRMGWAYWQSGKRAPITDNAARPQPPIQQSWCFQQLRLSMIA